MIEHSRGPWHLQKLPREDDGEAAYRITAESTLHLYITPCADGYVPGANEANARLIAAAPDLLAACRAVMAGTDLINRWPCPDCGRQGPDKPLRVIHCVLEDGTRVVQGCWPCNTDRHRAQVRAAIALVEKRGEDDRT